MPHWARVKEEVARLVAEVPLYADRPSPPPPAGDDPAAVAAWLATIPTITKRDLRRGFPKNLTRRGADLKAAMAAGTVEILSTSGTADDRAQVIRDPAWWRAQEEAALGAAASPLRHATLVPPAKGSSCHSGNLTRAEREQGGTLTLNQLADPAHFTDAELDRIVDEWRDFHPPVVIANPSYAAPVARRAAATGRPLETKTLYLTDELPTRAHRRAIAAPLADLYRSIEAGALFVACSAARMHATSGAHVELLPAGPGLARVIVTSLGRQWNPLLRYDTGDLALTTDGECPCGRPGPTIARIAGRVADSLEVAGTWLTPAQLDDAVDSPGLDAWQLLLLPAGPELATVGTDAARAHAAAAAEKLLGRPVRPRAEAIAPEASGKYRLIKKVEW